MQKHICLTLIGVLICSARPTANLPRVACPQHFRYVTTPLGNVKGVITVPYNNTKMKLEVKVVVDEIDDIHDKDKMNVKLIFLSLNGSTAVYQLVFSLGVPQITSIALNGLEYCNMNQNSKLTKDRLKREDKIVRSVGLLSETELPDEGDAYFYPASYADYQGIE